MKSLSTPTKPTVIFAIAILMFTVGLAVGKILDKRTSNQLTHELSEVHPIRNPDSQYKYISSLLAYETPEASELPEYKPLEKNISEYISQQQESGNIIRASTYFRSFNTGKWIAINEQEHYTPASLFKVPLLISYYRAIETKPEVATQTLTKTDSVDENALESIKPRESIQTGKTYTIEELLKYMIVDSDNNATALLFNAADKGVLQEVFTDLRIPVPTGSQSADFISVKDYAFLFRILYNSTYLWKQYSEAALALMGQTDFSDGIVAGIPNTIQVSHKFGEFSLVNNGTVTKRELHDCGIIYSSTSPYELCIMTEGSNLDELKKTISHISNIVYEQAGREIR